MKVYLQYIVRKYGHVQCITDHCVRVCMVTKTKYKNFHEARKVSWHDCIWPEH